MFFLFRVYVFSLESNCRHLYTKVKGVQLQYSTYRVKGVQSQYSTQRVKGVHSRVYNLSIAHKELKVYKGAKWLNVRVLDLRARGSSLTVVTALWSLSKTHLS